MANILVVRAIDYAYILFFLLHLAATVLIDLAPIYPAWIVPSALKQLIMDQTIAQNDPWLLATWDLVDRPFEWIWTKVFMYMEMSVSAHIQIQIHCLTNFI